MQQELAELDNEMVEIDGTLLKPSQCYHVGTNPAHILFNTNCPDDLKNKIDKILLKYSLLDEDRAQEERNDR
jgi:hypothetical protein